MERMAVRDRPPAEGVALAAHPALDRVPPWSMVLAGATSIQFGAALAATLFDDVGAAGTSLLRLGFAAVILVALWRPRVRSYTRGQLQLATIFGLALGAMNLAFYLALDRIPLGIAVTIEFAGPLAVAVFGSRRRLDLAWAALAAIGILLLADPGGGSLDALGLVFVGIAAACWAIYILVAQRASRVFHGSEGLTLAAVVAALIPLAPGVAEGGADLVRPEWLAIGVGVALLSSVVPYSLETEALRRIPANVFGVLMSLEPAIAALAGLLVLGQSLGARDLVAIGCVIAASIGVTRGTAPPPVDG
jgi:inner membrane transporter RhtA